LAGQRQKRVWHTHTRWRRLGPHSPSTYCCGHATGAVAGGKTQAQVADGHGDDEAEGRLKYVLWGPGGVGKSTLALKSVVERGERQRVTAAGVQFVGFDGAGLRGAARRDAGQERRAGAIVRGGTWAGPRAAAVSGVEQGVAGGPPTTCPPTTSLDDLRLSQRRPTTSWEATTSWPAPRKT